MARKFRPRKELKFWIALDIPEQARLMDFISYCKATRQFARVVRNGLRLMWSLGEGDTKVLYELFPWLQSQMAITPTPPDSSNLERQIADLKQILLHQGSISAPPPDYPSMKPAFGGLKKMALPLIDDDEDTIVLTKAVTNTGANLQASFAKMGLFG